MKAFILESWRINYDPADVEAVFTTREKAEAVMAQLPDYYERDGDRWAPNDTVYDIKAKFKLHEVPLDPSTIAGLNYYEPEQPPEAP